MKWKPLLHCEIAMKKMYEVETSHGINAPLLGTLLFNDYYSRFGHLLFVEYNLLFYCYYSLFDILRKT